MSSRLTAILTKSNKNLNDADDGYDPTFYIPNLMYCPLVNALQKGCLQQSILEIWSYDNEKIETLTKEDILLAINSTTIRYCTL